MLPTTRTTARRMPTSHVCRIPYRRRDRTTALRSTAMATNATPSRPYRATSGPARSAISTVSGSCACPKTPRWSRLAARAVGTTRAHASPDSRASGWAASVRATAATVCSALSVRSASCSRPHRSVSARRPATKSSPVLSVLPPPDGGSDASLPAFAPECNPPAAPGQGTCVDTTSPEFPCNPVTNAGCDPAASEACDNIGAGFQCIAGKHEGGICDPCTSLNCKAGSTCIPDLGCVKYCCGDTECAPGYCLRYPGLGGLGVCSAPEPDGGA
jgi:hypothetical protein